VLAEYYDVSFAGIKKLLIVGYGATLTGNYFHLAGFGMYNDNMHSTRVASVTAGSNSVTVTPNSSSQPAACNTISGCTALFKVGSWHSSPDSISCRVVSLRMLNSSSMCRSRELIPIRASSHSLLLLKIRSLRGPITARAGSTSLIMPDRPRSTRSIRHGLEVPRAFANSTSISGGIDFALAQFARAPFEAERRTIDVSGDGDNNNGRDVRFARDEAVAAGVTVNGLVILTDARSLLSSQHTNPPGGLEKYYRDHVIGGPGAFVLVAKDFNSFGSLLIKKLIAEIALMGPRDELVPR
jgi:Protein of unknown function (DUF1194)